ncbi:MAG TPA: DUF2764 family protein [Kiritimatiellia bacterium]|nr:DUF2764 family protein [Kiritimatiellia bacterium]
MKYPYFASSLPSVSLGSPTELELKTFVADCWRNLEPEDAAEVEALVEGRRLESGSRFYEEWTEAEVQLRNEVAKVRASRQAVATDERKYLHSHRGYRVWLDDAVQDALSRSSPLERELALDRIRWGYAEELAGEEEPFGQAYVLAYAVKLMLVHRWQAMSVEKGQAKLDELLEQITVTSDELAGWLGLAQM